MREVLGDPFVKEAFSPAMRRRVKAEQGGDCGCGCGRQIDQIHHRVPQQFNGSDRRENAIGLSRKCHQKYDKLAIENGIIFPDIPMSEAPQVLFKKK